MIYANRSDAVSGRTLPLSRIKGRMSRARHSAAPLGTLGEVHGFLLLRSLTKVR